MLLKMGTVFLSNGIGYSAAMIKQQGLTDEMVNLFNREFAPGNNLFYKIWCPDSHLLHYTDGAVEDFGWGRVNLKFTSNVFMEDLGLDISQIKKNDPACIQINGSCAVLENLEGETRGTLDRITIVNYHREIPNGREQRIRAWFGIGIEDGEYQYAIPSFGTSLLRAKDVMAHLIFEYSNISKLMLQFWSDRQLGLI